MHGLCCTALIFVKDQLIFSCRMSHVLDLFDCFYRGIVLFDSLSSISYKLEVRSDGLIKVSLHVFGQKTSQMMLLILC